MKLQRLNTVKDFQDLIAENFYTSGIFNFPEHDERIESEMLDEIGKGLYRLALQHPLLVGVSEFYVHSSRHSIHVCCELIVGKFAPQNGTVLAYSTDIDLVAEFSRDGSVVLLRDDLQYQIYLDKAVIKLDALKWVLDGYLKLSQSTDKP